jgi:hypothetical protein
MKRVPRFYSLDADALRSAIAADTNNVADFIACGKAIVAALPPGHQCGRVLFSNDADGHMYAAQHFIACKLNFGSYDAVCPCVCGIGCVIRDDSGSTANAATKARMKTWPAVADNERIPLLPAAGDMTDIDAFLHLAESDAVHKALAPDATALLTVLLKHSDQAGAQAFVDKFTGDALVDREDQIAAAVAVLQPAADGTAVAGGMYAALICGPPGTGKTHCGEEALYRLSKFQAQRRCMDKVTCRSALAVKSGLVQLGRRLGKALGVGPDTPVEDVLQALQKYLSTSP